MSVVKQAGQWMVLAYESLLAIPVGYLLLLTAGAVLQARRSRRSGRPPEGRPASAIKAEAPRSNEGPTRFLILVPAHNEEKLLPGLLANLKQLDYSAERYQVHVIADNCTDHTAELARRGGAVVHERTNLTQRGKGYALQWAISRILGAASEGGPGAPRSGEGRPDPGQAQAPAGSVAHSLLTAPPPTEPSSPFDALIILDADSIVSHNFLRAMDARLARGERAIQAYYAVRDPGRSWSVALRYAALAVLHYLRPMGRMALGGSVGLKGNGMVFDTSLARRYPWSASLTEDIEYHMALVLGGERVTFAHDAIVWAEMPGTLASAQTQNVRWERGRLEMLRQYVPLLLAGAWRAGNPRRAFLLFDTAMEQVIPPFSVLAGASVLGLLLALVLGLPLQASEGPLVKRARGRWAGVNLGLALVAGQATYTLAGLLLAGAPRRVYLALLAAPVMMAWKIWLYTRVLLGLDRQGWVRTGRDG